MNGKIKCPVGLQTLSDLVNKDSAVAGEDGETLLAGKVVYFEESLSEIRLIRDEVPQGSTLSTLFYSLYKPDFA